MKFELQSADGKKFEVEAPDQQAALEAFNQFSMPTAGEDIAKGAPGWGAKGMGMLLTAPEQAAKAIKMPIDWALNKAIPGYNEELQRQEKLRSENSLLPSPAELVDKIPTRQAQTTPGKYVQNIMENAPSGVIGAGGWKDIPKYVTALGAVPAAASEFVGQLPSVEGTWLEGPARGAMALLTGGVGAMAMRPNTATQAIGRDLGGLTEAQLQPIVAQAQNLMQRAAAQNPPINLSWAQAIEHVAPGTTNLPKTQRYIERTESGANELKPFYAGQPQAMQDAVENTAGMIAPRSANPAMIGPEASQAAQSTLDRVNTAINNSTRDLYQASRGDVIPDATYKILAGDASYAEALSRIRGNKELNAQIATLPDNSVGVVEYVRRYLQKAAEAGAVSTDANERFLASLRGSIGNEAENISTRVSPNLAQAQAEQATARQQYLNPLQQGPVGNVARSDSTQGAINAVFPRTPQAGSENEVVQAIQALGARNPTIPQNIVAQHMRNTANQEMKQLPGGENYYGGARFAREIAGNPQAEQNFLSATRALNRGQQIRPEVENLIEVLRATGKRLPEGSQTATDLGKAADNTPRMFLNPKRFVDFGEDAYKTWRMQNSARQTAQVLMDPEAMATLLQAARTNQGSPAQAILLNMLLSSQPSTQ